ncbi:MAG: polyphosphate:AMP phosphotransferase [Moraxellaceae bacterium]
MFEAAEVGQKISREDYKARLPQLRQALLDAQYQILEQARFPVVIVVGGVDGAGKGETVNLFNEWMDPRHISTFGFGPPSEEEAQRPPMWRFWQALPPKGRIGMLFGSWYTDPIVARTTGKSSAEKLQHEIDEICAFENMLCTEGVVLVKFWFHLSESAQKERLEELEKNPATRWRVSETDWERFKQYKTFRKISESAIAATHGAAAPWHIVEGSDPYYRALTAGEILLQAMQQSLQQIAPPAIPAAPALPAAKHVLRTLDYSLKMKRKEYEEELEIWQGKLNLLTREKGFAKKSLVLVFEGQDAAGKGGAIRRITSALDARQYNVIPVSAPSAEERAQPWLWRFWHRLPRHAHIAIFDRSWYGRVLVERVEGFASTAEWNRAFDEINHFEEQLTESGSIVVKFWLAVTKEEQLKRFKERENVAFKNHKITPDDWRNRDRWDDYELAVDDMVARTSTKQAPWTLVPSDDVEYARIMVLKTLCAVLEKNIGKK